jgi:4-hydroxythreonine-4-phosphate dehydrogenase
MRIVISCGDVNGIGLRCLAGAISMIPRDASYILAIDASTLREAAQAYQLPGTITDDAWHVHDIAIALAPLNATTVVTPGVAGDDASRCAIASLELARAMCRDGRADAMVTLPINKHALASVGWPYPGQTEMVADGGHGEPLMVLSSGSVRVALTTVHVPLRDVVSALSVDRIGERIQQLHDHCRRDYGITSPSIAVLAVDPHAGDHGTIGTADTELTLPAIARAREAGMQVDGPFPADGFFAFGAYRQYDGILAMYHDQGLIPLKVLAQGGGVNTTAGIDIVRTSPDHGTAYQLAAGGLHIDARSTYEAVTLACTIAAQRRAIA